MTDVLHRVAAASEEVGRALLAARGTRPGGGLSAGRCELRADGAVLADPRLWLAGTPRLTAVAEAHDLLGGATLRPTVARLDGAERTAAAAVATLAQPVEVLLSVGGDDRQVPTSGVTSYGMPLADPSPVLRASSCTATPPDAEALAVAARWRDRVLAAVLADRQAPDPERLRARLATRLVRLLGLPESAADRVALSPSGTDVESLVTALVLGASDRDVVVVTVGTREAGSGTTNAAGLRAFRATSPFAVGLAPGQPLAGVDHARLCVVDVELRDAAGRVRQASDIEAEIEAHVEDAIGRGARVLVHVIEGSKTGLRCPSPAWVRVWHDRYPDDLRVVVDAAQARAPRRDLRAHLAAGAAVFVTGSKAIGAPPFCGALLLDDGLLADGARLDALPSGLACSVAAGDLPPALSGLAAGFEPVNLGLVARWEVGLAEWERLEVLGPELRREVCSALLDGWRSGLGALAGVDVLPTAPGAVPTVVSFRIDDGDGRWMGKAALAEVYARAISAPGVYIGQPVELVHGRQGVLRLAVGAPTVTRLVDRADRLGGLDAAVAEVVGIAVECIAGGLPAGVALR